jgi:hypothetical protein
MQLVKAFEFTDLSPDVAEKVKDEYTSTQVEAELRTLQEDVDAGIITEDKMYKTIGCTKYYAESTSWFVPSVYYEHNQEQVDEDVKDTLSRILFNEWGDFIGYKEENGVSDA